MRQKNVFAYKREIKRILSKNNYDVVYVNMLSAANIIPIKLAKKYNIKKIIAHSHSSSLPNNIVKIVSHILNKNKISKYANTFIACSKKAGDWLFNKENYIVLSNSIDLAKFSFNKEYAETKDEKFKNKKIIGHVGRFFDTKNQEFIVDFFKKIIDSDKNYGLYLIGNGEDKEKIRKKVENLNLSDYVSIVDATEDVYKYYSKFDIFILPSKFEGLPIVGIEAQANGLPCLFSNTITNELKINDNVKFLGIDDLDEWVNAIKNPMKRTNNIKLINSEYDINFNYKRLEKIINEK